ncbi:hypothetical protein BD560DRAFT_424794 [Blakeslea trispora]|nr:hypothetical protein BD560DRAFT_424794 [Blakeslea trispora]
MSLKRSKTTHSSVENSIEGIKHMLEVILTKVSSIESKCEGFDRRLDELEATVACRCRCRPGNLLHPSTQKQPHFSSKRKRWKAEVLSCFKQAWKMRMRRLFGDAKLSRQRSFACFKRTWREVLAEDKNSMKQQVLTYAVASYPQLGFLEGCVDLWPITALIQPKWSLMSTHARRKRKIQDLEEENQKLREQ